MAKMGRRPKKIDIEQLRAFMRLKPTITDTAHFFQCSEDTISNRIKRYTGLTFSVFRDQNMVHTRFALVRKAIQMGESGNVPMLIFTLKNLCGWADKVENTVQGPKDEKKRLVINFGVPLTPKE